MSIRKILFLAVAGFIISSAVMAADLDGNSTARTFSNELLGTAAAADIVAGDVLGVALGAEYAVGDIITLTFSGSALEAGVLTSIAVPKTLVAPLISGITLVLLSADADSAVYRLTAIDPVTPPTTVGVVVEFAAADDLEFDARAVDAAGGVTVSYSAATSTGIRLDTGGGDLSSIDYLVVDDEYEATVTLPFDQIVDVETERETFTIGVDDTATTTLTKAVFFSETVFVDQDIVWTGDFGWIIDDDPATADVQPLTGVVDVAGPGCGSVVVTPTTISFTCAGTGAINLTLDPSVNLDVDGNLSILPATVYTVTVTVNFTGFGGATGSASFTESAGSWRDITPVAISVTIDIKPGKFSDRPNRLDPNHNSIKVAILGTMDFDALQVDQTTIRFGPDEAPLDPARCKVKDFNEDGLSDLSCKFKISETGIVCGDTEATLIGETFGGESISGTDSIETVGCP